MRIPLVTELVALAQAPETPAETLRGLVLDADEQVAMLVAVHPNLPDSAHDALSLHPSCEVRLMAARRERITERAILLYSLDQSPLVRKAVAESSASTPSVLTKLISDSNEEVRRAVASSKNVTDAILRYFSNDISPMVRAAVAESPTASGDVLERLACDESVVQCAVASNPLTRIDTLFWLIVDGNDDRVVEECINALRVRPLESWMQLVGEQKINLQSRAGIEDSDMQLGDWLLDKGMTDCYQWIQAAELAIKVEQHAVASQCESTVSSRVRFSL